DWAPEEIPTALAQIGPAVIPALSAFLADSSHELRARLHLIESLSRMPEEHPEARAECVAVLMRQLEVAERNDPEFNGFLIAALVDRGADEAAPVVERAFAGGHVDDSIAGNWDEVRYEMGLSDEPPPSRFIEHLGPSLGYPDLPPLGDVPRPSHKAKAKAKA